MREIKFRAWDVLEKKYYFPKIFSEAIVIQLGGVVGRFDGKEYGMVRHDNIILEQYTGLKDRNGKEIYDGCVVRYRLPYRTTQTHTGDNIPNGSYTEPMEPGIKEIVGVVMFVDGAFVLDDDVEGYTQPLSWRIREWDLESIKDAISWTRQSANWFDDPEEGDLQYLITEVAKVETAEQLIQYLSGIEIIGNVHENTELI